MYSYSSISKFGKMAQPSPVNNPLTYCINNTLDNKFLHGATGDTNIISGGQGCRQCQLFLSDYCAQGWDNYCELASQDLNTRYPSVMDIPNSGVLPQDYNKAICLTQGEVLIRNTASRKYLVKMNQGEERWEPFDPTVADSPLIRYWVPIDGPTPMNPVYAVDSKTIDDDEVMNKILQKPRIANDILKNIYLTMSRNGTINQLNDTKLGKFFESNKNFFSNLKNN
jgi:hypothetical protein